MPAGRRRRALDNIAAFEESPFSGLRRNPQREFVGAQPPAQVLQARIDSFSLLADPRSSPAPHPPGA